MKMNRNLKTVIFLAAFILLMLLAVILYNTLGRDVAPKNAIDMAQDGETATENGGAQTDRPEEEKTEAPDFTVTDMDGNSVKLSEMIGKPIVLNFWASWCGPCKSEMPAFDEVYASEGEDIVFMMINLVDGQVETVEKATEYVQGEGFTFPVYFDTEQEAAYAYGVRGIPLTVFIDSDGYIVTAANMPLDAETLQKGIELIK